jgi:hypothetical protein
MDARETAAIGQMGRAATLPTDDLPMPGKKLPEHTLIADHSASMLHAAVCLLREKPPHLSSLIVIIAICGMVLTVVAHGEVASIVIGAIVVAAFVVAGFKVK